MKVREQSEQAGLKLNIQKTKIMASGPIISWQKDGQTLETLDFFLGSKSTVDGYCSQEMKRRLPFGRKADKPRQHVKKQRHYFAHKGLVKAMAFPVVSHVWMFRVGPSRKLSAEELTLLNCGIGEG